MTTSAFPEFLNTQGFMPLKRVGEATFSESWRARKVKTGTLRQLWQSLSPNRKLRSEDGDCLVRLVPTSMPTEGHYGYTYENVDERLQSIAERLNSASQRFPEQIVPMNCVLTSGYFVMIRRWFEQSLLEAIGRNAVLEDGCSWPGALQQLALQVDECWAIQPDLPFAVRSSNVFVAQGRCYLADQGAALLRELVWSTYAGPFIAKIRRDEGMAFDQPLPGLPPVHQFAGMWTYIRTGLAALRADMPAKGVENGVDRLVGGEKEIVESTLYDEQPPHQRCANLVNALRAAADRDAPLD